MEKVNYSSHKSYTYWIVLAVAITSTLFFGDDKLWQRLISIVLLIGIAALLAPFAGVFWPVPYMNRLKVVYVILLFIMAFVQWVSEEPSSYKVCPHCNGNSQRINNITGKYGKCASCDGTGKVTQWQYDHMVK